MARKQPMQADGGGKSRRRDGVSEPLADALQSGESQGGPPVPREAKGRNKKSKHGFMGHGGQSEIAYHGTGQLGDTDVPGRKNPNSVTRKG